jgi:group I intron endonuclease
MLVNKWKPKYNNRIECVNSNKGIKHSEELNKKMSELFSGENNPFYNRYHTEETKKLMSKNHADFTGENHPMFNKKHSEKSKQKMSISKKGKPKPPGFGEKISKLKIGIKRSGNFTSKYIGVGFSRRDNKWRARIHYDQRQISIGYFKSEIEAALAYNAKALELYGDEARLNIIDK